MPDQVSVHPDGTPQRLGRYRLLRPISTGGMARVFEGRRESLAGVSPRVAIKVILPDYAQDPSFRELFINEARIGSLLQHQNLVQIQDFDAENGQYYLVMEYVEGVTLRRAISLCRRHGVGVPVSVIAEIGRQVCDGLHYAHTARDEGGKALHLVHRDLKPSNLMLNPQGVAKLLDFGISRALLTAERTGAVRGTWGYMAPEQAAGRQVGPQADLFGLAAVLYELAAFEPLFPEKEPEAIRQLFTLDEAARRATRLAGPPGRLSGVLVRALQRDPGARFETAAAMGRALGALVTDPVTARDQVVQFQLLVTDLSQAPLPPEGASSAVTLDPPVSAARSGASLSPAQESAVPGLPVAVGGRHGPVPSASQPPPVPPRRAVWLPWVQAAAAGSFAAIALLVVAYTAWSLIRPEPTPPSVPHPQVTQAPPPTPAAPAPVEPTEPASAQPVESAGSSAAVLTAEAPPPPSAPPSVAPPAPEHAAAPPRASSPPQDDVVARIAPEDAPPQPVEPAPPQPADVPPQHDTEPVSTAPTTNQQMGILTVSSIPRAKVVVDGRFIRYSPLFRFEVEAGTRVVTLITDDGRRTTFRVEVPAGGDARKVWSFETGGFTGE